MPAKISTLSKRADKSITRFPLRIQNKIDQAFERIKQNPISGAKLHGDLSGFYKYKIGDYRVIYEFDPKISTVNVLKIEHRQGVYK